MGHRSLCYKEFSSLPSYVLSIYFWNFLQRESDCTFKPGYPAPVPYMLSIFQFFYSLFLYVIYFILVWNIPGGVYLKYSPGYVLLGFSWPLKWHDLQLMMESLSISPLKSQKMEISNFFHSNIFCIYLCYCLRIPPSIIAILSGSYIQENPSWENMPPPPTGMKPPPGLSRLQ